MKVKELIKKLEAFDQNLEIIIYSQDLNRPLEIENISKAKLEKFRNEANEAMVRFASSDNSFDYAFIEVTTDI